MTISVAEQVADAGMALAGHSTVQTCARELVQRVVDLTAARTAAFVGVGSLRDVSVGSPPSVPVVTTSGAEAGAVLADDGTFTAVCVRGTSGAGWAGVLWVELHGDGEGIRLAQLLARQAGVALTVVLRGQELELRERQHMALVEAGKSLAQQRSLDAVLRRIVELAVELAGARYGALGIVDPETGATLSDFITVGVDDETAAAIGDRPSGKGLLGVLIGDPRPLRLAHITDHPASSGFPPGHPPMESFLGVPIRTSRETKGRIYLTEKDGGAVFTEVDEELVVTLASQAGIAIENAELYERIEHSAEELQRANARLMEADRHKSAFLASMSHELRSPLNTIIGYTRLLLDEPETLSEEQVEDLSIIEASGRHLLRLISDLLDLSRIEAGRVDLYLESTDAAYVAEEVAAAVRPQADAAGLEVSVERSGDTMLSCDPGRLEQMLRNVVGNAIKFTERGGVRIVVDGDAADHVILRAVDTGPGIPAEDLARIFESFFQSGDAISRTPRAAEGAGLGLAITRNLAELHGGSVRMDSEEGVGTTVTIVLPRIAAAVDRPQEADL